MTAIDNGLFRQSQTHQGVQADFWGLKNLICFLLNKGRAVTALRLPQSQRRGVKCPRTQLQGWHSHTKTNTPTNAGGQRPEITIMEGLKGGLTGGMAHYVNHPPIGSVFYLVSCQ